MARMIATIALLVIGCSSAGSPEGGMGAVDAGPTIAPDAGPPVIDTTPPDAGRRNREPRIDYTARLVVIDGGDSDCLSARAGNIVFQGVHRESGRTLTYGSACINPATTELLAPGTYDVTFTLYNRSMQPISTAKGTYLIDERSGVDVEVVFPIQSFHVSWTIVRDTGAGRVPLTCQEAGAAFVDFAPALAGDPFVGHYGPECRNGPINTMAVPLGHYTYEVRLLDTTGNQLATTGSRELDVTADRRAVIPVEFTVR